MIARAPRLQDSILFADIDLRARSDRRTRIGCSCSIAGRSSTHSGSADHESLSRSPVRSDGAGGGDRVFRNQVADKLFATLAEARQAGAIANGWIPEGLPSGAHDIREGHVPGTSQHWGLFEFPNGEEAHAACAAEARRRCRPTASRCDVPARIEWWPLVLRGPLDGTRLAATGMRLYRASTGDVLFAVNWNQGRAYYWRQ